MPSSSCIPIGVAVVSPTKPASGRFDGISMLSSDVKG